MTGIIELILNLFLILTFGSPILLIIFLTLNGVFNLEEKIKRRRFKPKSRTERKVLKEIKKIEREIEERKRLEHLYEKRDELIRKMEGWYE
ncbi:hypothetical protein [Staphylococcus chromogenes]|uniref:hypothetical protein n=1 Tax=Staphylococcus chromogenes TaxID=46126 RepID=UPI003D7B83A3